MASSAPPQLLSPSLPLTTVRSSQAKGGSLSKDSVYQVRQELGNKTCQRSCYELKADYCLNVFYRFLKEGKMNGALPARHLLRKR